MSSSPPSTLSSSVAARMRRDFDRAFAEAREREAPALVNLLILQVAGDAYAIRLTEVSSLHADRTIVPVPSESSDLLGLVGFRGALAPVFDLRILLGYGGGALPRWFLLLQGADPVGLGFDHFEAHLQVRAEDLSQSTLSHEAGARATSPFIGGVVRTANGVHSLIHTASIVEAIRGRVPLDKAPGE
jgi:chemotaxis signal transduction protein